MTREHQPDGAVLFSCHFIGGERMPAKRTETGRFAKGSSGNPSGRPKIDAEIKEMLRGATPKAVQLLIQTVDDQEAPLKLRLDAAGTILDRVYGKPTQPIDADITTAAADIDQEDVIKALGALGYVKPD